MKIDAVAILGILAVAGVVPVVGCRQNAESEPSKTVAVVRQADALVFPSPPPLEAGAVSSRVLMVWRDTVTGKLTSRTLPPEAKAYVMSGPADDSRRYPVTLALQVDAQAVAAVK